MYKRRARVGGLANDRIRKSGGASGSGEIDKPKSETWRVTGSGSPEELPGAGKSTKRGLPGTLATAHSRDGVERRGEIIKMKSRCNLHRQTREKTIYVNI